MDAKVLLTSLLTVNIMDEIFTTERCVPRDLVDLDPGQGDLDGRWKVYRRLAISDKMYKADVEVEKSRRQDFRRQIVTFWMNGQDQVC